VVCFYRKEIVRRRFSRRHRYHHTLFEEEEAVYPGGSGMPADFGFEMGGVLRSTTHCGGGGADEVIVVDIVGDFV
jgi:hypothetical protein